MISDRLHHLHSSVSRHIMVIMCDPVSPFAPGVFMRSRFPHKENPACKKCEVAPNQLQTLLKRQLEETLHTLWNAANDKFLIICPLLNLADVTQGVFPVFE